MDSFVNLADTTAQTMASNLIVPGLTVNGSMSVASYVGTRITTVGTVAGGSLIAVSAHVTDRLTWGSVAGSELSVNGTVKCVAVNVFVGSMTAYTTAQTSAFFAQVGTPDMAAVKFLKCVVNGSAYSIPLFRGSIAG